MNPMYTFPSYLQFILITFSHINLTVQAVLPTELLIKIFFLFTHFFHAWWMPTHIIPLYKINLIISDERYGLWSSSLSNCLHLLDIVTWITVTTDGIWIRDSRLATTSNYSATTNLYNSLLHTYSCSQPSLVVSRQRLLTVEILQLSALKSLMSDESPANELLQSILSRPGASL
jgi:hypothetical protein